MMIIINRLSKKHHVKFINELTFERIVQIFYHIFWKIHEFSNTIVFDRKTQFVNHFWKQLIERLKIKTRLSTIYHSKIDDQTKIMNVEIKTFLKVFCSYLQNDWIIWCFSIEFAINNHVSKITKFTSFFVNFDQHSRMSIEFFKNLIEMNFIIRQRRLKKHVDEYVIKMNTINEELKTQMIWTHVKQKRFVNAHRKNVFKYVINDKIWLNIRNIKTKRFNKKLSDKNDEFFFIKVVHDFYVYEFELFVDWNIYFVFHISLLHKNSNDSLSSQISFELLLDYIDENDNEFWKIEEILITKIRFNRLKILIKWADYKTEWKFMKNIVENVEELMKIFYEKHSQTVDVDFW